MVQAHAGTSCRTYVKRSGRCSVILLFLLPLLSVLSASGDTLDVGDPTVTIIVDEDTKNALVEPGKNGLVIFTGTIIVEPATDGGASSYYKLDLRATSIQGWPVSISPSSILFMSSGGSGHFSLSVRPPAATPCTEVDTVIIDGTCTTSPGEQQSEIPEERGTILIKQYYIFEVTCPNRQIVTGGGPVVYPFSVHNSGNGVDTFEIAVANSDSLDSHDIKVYFSSKTLTIERQKTGTFTVTVQGGEGTGGYERFAVPIRITSEGSEAEGEAVSETEYIYVELEASDFVIGALAALIILLIVLMSAVIMLDRRRRMRKMRALIAKMREEKE